MAFEELIADRFLGLIGGLNCTSDEFAAFFLQSQVGLTLDKRIGFEVLTALDQNAAEAYQTCFYRAHSKQFFEELITILIAEGGLTEEYLASLLTDNGATNATLEAITGLERGFRIPEIGINGLINGSRWTGQVEIDGIAAGSGVLIGPHLFLTAWHVVRPLFNATQDGYVPDDSQNHQLTILFDNRDRFSSDGRRQLPPMPLRVPAAPDWCVAHSPCHELELANQNPPDLGELEHCWDYAVIKLASPVGLHRRYARLDARSAVPRPREPVVIFQYPRAVPLRYDENQVVASMRMEQTYIPALRFLHDVNTADGSSGGPCFDKSFNCFGLHQGVWNASTNKGVPIKAILSDIDQRFRGLPTLTPEEHAIWTFNENAPEPIVGCEGFQSLIWQSISSTGRRLILIAGEKGAGKSFRLRVLQKMLSEGAHLKIELNAQLIGKLDAATFLQYMGKTLQVDMGPIIPLTDENSSPVLWLRDELLPKLIAMLEAKRAGRLVWLLFSNMNQHSLEGAYLNDFFLLICQQVQQADWLRVVIDGGSPQLPQDIAQWTQLHSVERITEEQIKTFFQYYFAYLDIQIDSRILDVFVHRAMNHYRRWRDEDPAKAMRALHDHLLELMEELSRYGTAH